LSVTDVVVAYKELQREKVALEESLKALSLADSSSSTDTRSFLRKNQKKVAESAGDDEDTASTSHSGRDADLGDISVTRLLT
jgi:hypothetical protein